MQTKKRFIIFTIMVTSLLSMTTFFLVLNYLDPYSHTILAIGMLMTSFVLASSCFSCLVLYFIKKVYFRGDVYLFHVVNSFRQGFFITLFLLGLIIFNIIGAHIIITPIALLMLFIFLELFIQDLSD